ncbi:hypothetical protein G6011_06985 [Alternaria panax]|uniref:FAD-binding PCMH-type domain-containing protein n=1 Tax=Alternaria panax TaxID=48097 RepID=A0AAD4I7J6_9PLEO|nr:hypothetical protein G6011_06985 [Alternaria panax]
MKNLWLATVLTAATAATAQNATFVQCLEAAVGNDTNLYSLPSDPLFLQGDVTPYNLNYLTVPTAIVSPRTKQQVSGVVKCAHTAGVAVQARSGGHSYANYGLGGFNGSLVVDMKNMAAFTYNEADETATFGPGNLLGNLSQKLQPLGRVMAYGEVSVIGSGGHMTIGGLGTLSRQLGLATDQIVSAQCVIANGSIVTASASTNPDLFFAIRGAGFSFAIVTEFTMKTAPAPSEITQYMFNVTARDVTSFASTFQGWQNLVSQPSLSRQFSSTVTLSQGSMIINGIFYGPRSDFDALNAQSILPANGSAILTQSTVATVPFMGLGDPILTATGSFPIHFYAKSVKTTNRTLMSNETVQSMFSYINATEKGSPVWLVIWDLEGGAISDVSQTNTAYWHRDALYFMQSYVVSLTGPVSDVSKSFLAGLSSLVQRETGADESAYTGYVDPELVDPQKSYWGCNLPRLQQVKAALDPDNVFRNPQTVSTVYNTSVCSTEQFTLPTTGSAAPAYVGSHALLLSLVLVAAAFFF